MKKDYIIHFYWLFLKLSKAFSVSLSQSKTAFSECAKKLVLSVGTEDDINIAGAIPWQFLKIGEVDTVDSNSIQLTCKEWPVNVNTDGCATNVTASKLISVRLALFSPCTRCMSHVTEGCVMWKEWSTQKPWMCKKCLNFYYHFVLPCIISNLVEKVWHCSMKLWLSSAWNLFVSWRFIWLRCATY